MSQVPSSPYSEIDRARVAWHISSRSGSGGAQCVEAGPVLDGSGQVAVRHSHHPDGDLLAFAGPAWRSFVTSVKAGTLDR